ncbi:CBS domain-containing protein [Patescibacteria group bacterium]|nr:CBS domain-containing protein [Patescibacteria group bacterium]
MKISEIMQTDVIAVEAETPVKEVAQKLVDNNITGMPVVKGDEVIGLVTEADLIMQKAKIHIPMYIQLLDSALFLEDTAEVEEDLNKILGMTAEKIMTNQVVTIDVDDTVENLATLIEEHHINPIPVTEKNKLVGIVSRADIVKLLIRE